MSVEERKKRTWERRMDECKRKHRPKLKDWAKDGFATTRRDDFHALRTIDVPTREVGRIDARIAGVKDFRDRFERRNLPCIVQNIPQAEGWAAPQRWTLPLLRERFKERLCKVGEDDDGYKVKAKMKHFVDYFTRNTDDSPLYMFDGNFDEDKSNTQSLLRDYAVPSFFPEDLFSVVGEERRPPYRWFLMGPERSGSTVHLDPLGTSAWNTLISGRKRWVLFPPHTPKSVAKGVDVLRKGEDDEAINYFVDLLPRIREKHGHEIEIYELIQYPGETIFVPGGWWHGVINLDDTIAITQNFCSSVNFDSVWRETRSGRKKMSQKWLKKLQQSHPDLAARALELNAVDGFSWAPSKGKKKKKDKKEKEKEREEKKRKHGEDDATSSEDDSKHKRKRNM